MRVFLIAAVLSTVSLCAQTPLVMQMECKDSAAISPDERIALLAKEIDRGDKQNLECMFSFMDDLSRSEDARALPLIARYLDVPNPRLEKDLGKGAKIGRPELFGGRFPAIIYIVEYRKEAAPVLVQAIASEPGLTLKAKNATLALMTVEAPDPPKGVRLLAEAAARASGASAKALSQAAQFATTTWECHLILAKCEGALTGRTAPIPPEAKPQ